MGGASVVAVAVAVAVGTEEAVVGSGGAPFSDEGAAPRLLRLFLPIVVVVGSRRRRRRRLPTV
jgi:hypothetical protein